MISDVALIELAPAPVWSAPVLFKNCVKLVCLPSTAAKVGKQGVISGEDIFKIWNASPHERTFPVNDIGVLFSKLNIAKNRKAET